MLAVLASILLTAVSGGLVGTTFIFRNGQLKYIRGPDALFCKPPSISISPISQYKYANYYCQDREEGLWKQYVNGLAIFDGLTQAQDAMVTDVCSEKEGDGNCYVLDSDGYCVIIGDDSYEMGWVYKRLPLCAVDLSLGADASIGISQEALFEAFPNATFMDLDAPQFVDVDTAPLQSVGDANSTPFPSVIVGAACGAMVFVAAAVLVLMRKSRKRADSTGPKHAEAHHVAEMSPTDIVDPATADMPAEDAVETVVVVEEDVA